MAAAEAQEDRDRRLGLARLDPRRQLQGLAAVAELDHVLAGDPHPVGQGLADEGGVVPGHPVHRLGQLLEPAVVGEPAVPDRRVGAEDELEPLGGRVASRRPGRLWTFGLTSLALRAVPVDHALAQGCPPGRLEVARQRLPPPVVADHLERRAVGLAQEDAQQLDGRLAGVERRDQGLLDRRRAVEGADVAPRLQRVGLGDVPVAEPGGLVLVGPKVDPERDLGSSRSSSANFRSAGAS